MVPENLDSLMHFPYFCKYTKRTLRFVRFHQYQ